MTLRHKLLINFLSFYSDPMSSLILSGVIGGLTMASFFAYAWTLPRWIDAQGYSRGSDFGFTVLMLGMFVSIVNAVIGDVLIKKWAIKQAKKHGAEVENQYPMFMNPF
jgi:hypothetical protein